MNCWEILGIEATSDCTAIKTAYAAKAKEWHPEEYPEEFKRLQSAYRTASHLAKMQKENPVPSKESGHIATEAMVEREAGKEITETGSVKEEQAIEKEEAAREEARQHYDYDAVAEADYYDYKEAVEADLNDQFFTEFFCIAWNPYLMNNLVCWEYMLKSSPYDELLSSKAFRYNFVRTVCHRLSGWQRETILFFEKWLQSREVEEEGQERKKETDLFCWKLKKIGLLQKFASTQRCATKEQKKLHGIFLAKVERCGRDAGLASEADVECYLSFYLPYALGKQPVMEDMYFDNSQGRTFLSTLLILIPLVIGMIICANVRGYSRQDEDAAQETTQQILQNPAEGLLKYHETLWEDESSREEWLQKYQEELRQEFLRNNSELFIEYYKDFPDSEVIADVITEMEEMGIDVFEDTAAAEEE